MSEHRGRRFREEDDDEFENDVRDVDISQQIRVQRRKRARRNKLFLGFLMMSISVMIVGTIAYNILYREEVSDVLSGAFDIVGGLFLSEDEESIVTGELIEIVIPDGASTTAIAEILYENELISSVLQFRVKSRLEEYDGTFKRGTYDIDKGTNTKDIMDILQLGTVVQENKITIPEGYTVQQIAKKVEEIGFATAEEFIDEVQNGVFDYDFINDIPEDRDYRLEGYLFPNTYMVSEKSTVNDLIGIMLAEFNRVYETEMKPYLDTYEHGYTLDELVVMASIIEKEIVVVEEKPRAAGVIYNRLDAGMPLQMDATVLYAMGIVKEDVTYADLEIESPYNTYKVNGLPVGPISNPGALSLVATVNPEEHKYIYYVLEAKGQSNHVYTETYDDFLKAKEKYKNS